MYEFESTPIALRFSERVLGGTPKSPELIAPWLASRAKPPIAGESASAEEWTEERIAEIAALIEPSEEKAWAGFLRDDDGIFLPQTALLAFVRDMASTLGVLKKTRGMRQTLQHTMAIVPRRVRFVRDDSVVREPDGSIEYALHVMTAQGPRTSIARADFVEAGTELAFEVVTIAAREPRLSEDEIRAFFRAGGVTNGLGARRSQGFGRFDVLTKEKDDA